MLLYKKLLLMTFGTTLVKKNQTFASCYLYRFHRRTLSIAPDNIHLDYKPHYADGEDIAPTRRSCITGLAVICGR